MIRFKHLFSLLDDCFLCQIITHICFHATHMWHTVVTLSATDTYAHAIAMGFETELIIKQQSLLIWWNFFQNYYGKKKLLQFIESSLEKYFDTTNRIFKIRKIGSIFSNEENIRGRLYVDCHPGKSLQLGNILAYVVCFEGYTICSYAWPLSNKLIQPFQMYWL